ncbi:MAG: TPM domain-containing protein [Novosphingobium sp.]
MSAHEPILTPADHKRISAAVSAAEEGTTGEIVTILAEQSDDYHDVALVWAGAAAVIALTVIALLPDFYLGLFSALLGQWNVGWTAPHALVLAALVAALKFGSVWLIMLWRPLRLFLTPPPVKHARVRNRAIAAFRIGADRRTQGRTGILIYLSMAEHRAEIVADEAIASRIAPEAWGDAMAAMLADLKAGRTADGMIAAIGQIGAILAEHLPGDADNTNELPDRLIEV